MGIHQSCLQDSDFDPDREDGEEANGTASGHHRSAANATQASAAEDGDASEDLEAEVHLPLLLCCISPQPCAFVWVC